MDDRERRNAALGRRFGLSGPQIRLLAVLGAYGSVGAGEAEVAAGLWGPSDYRRALGMLRHLHAMGLVELCSPGPWRVTPAGRAPFADAE